jgi:cytochrome c-type biogenesis protein CcmH/NrfG
MSLGNAHAALVPLKMKDISENAFKEAEGKYLLAQKTNPKNPSIFLSLAELNAAAGKKDGAIGYAKEALSLKSDYAEALSLLAELEGTVKKK